MVLHRLVSMPTTATMRAHVNESQRWHAHHERSWEFDAQARTRAYACAHTHTLISCQRGIPHPPRTLLRMLLVKSMKELLAAGRLSAGSCFAGLAALAEAGLAAGLATAAGLAAAAGLGRATGLGLALMAGALGAEAGAGPFPAVAPRTGTRGSQGRYRREHCHCHCLRCRRGASPCGSPGSTQQACAPLAHSWY